MVDETIVPSSYLVTGTTGFIGKAFTTLLLSRGYDVWSLDRTAVVPDGGLERQPFERRLTIDLGTAPQKLISKQMPRVEVIVHIAAAGVTNRNLDYERLKTVNVHGTSKLLKAAQENGVRRFIHIGSCFEYGSGLDLKETAELNPLSDYAKTKVEATSLVLDQSKLFERGASVLRPFMVYGPGEINSRLIPHIIKRAFRDEEIELTLGTQIRDLVFVDDVVNAFVLASQADHLEGEVINLCSGRGITVEEIVRTVLHLTGSKSRLNLGAVPYRENEGMLMVGSPEKAMAKLGWSASTSAEDGLSKTISKSRTT